MKKPAQTDGHQEQPAPDTPAAEPKYPGKGFRLGEYVIEAALGQGSMATVYLARDASDNEVAIKLFVEGAGVSATMLERFRRESEATKKLRRHPNILTVYASGREGPYHYIVMENIQRSKTLESALESTSMSIADCVLMVIKIARALSYAHARRILHRDVKPTNILIDEFGEPRLSDFGVATLTDWPSCTVTGALTGTPLYMSPEQARTEKLTPASDVYSLGVVLFEALTGVLPYHAMRGSPVRDVLKAVTEEEPRRPRVFRKDISVDLEAVIMKALEKDPRDRYADAASFATDLEKALIGRPVSARKVNSFDRLRHYARRHRQALAVVSVGLILASGIYMFFRQQLEDVLYESLLHKAQLHGTAARMERQPPEPLTTSVEAQRAWHEIRLGRSAMQAGDWPRAQFMMNTAAGLSEAMGDARTMAIAQLDEARCAVMLYGQDRAMHIYADILSNRHASPATVAMAQLEYIWLALIRDDVDRAVQIIRQAPIPTEGPIRPLILCLGGELTADALQDMINDMPSRYHNTAYLVMGIRHYLDGDMRRSAAALRQAIQVSVPAFDWPAPFARMLLSDLIRT